MKYTKLELEVILLNSNDVITTSGGLTDGGAGSTTEGGSGSIPDGAFGWN